MINRSVLKKEHVEINFATFALEHCLNIQSY